MNSSVLSTFTAFCLMICIEANGTQLEVIKGQQRLTEQTYYTLGYMALGVAVLWHLPEDFSQWYDKPDLTLSGISQRWAENIQSGPVWDGDIRLFNSYSHIHIGAAYTMMCLDAGLAKLKCMWYTNLMSLAWEFGPESLTEIPSWQDILMTGPVGARVGFQFFEWRNQIDRNEGKVLGSKYAGTFFKFLLDPLGYLTRPFLSKKERKNHVFILFPEEEKTNLLWTFHY